MSAMSGDGGETGGRRLSEALRQADLLAERAALKAQGGARAGQGRDVAPAAGGAGPDAGPGAGSGGTLKSAEAMAAARSLKGAGSAQDVAQRMREAFRAEARSAGRAAPGPVAGTMSGGRAAAPAAQEERRAVAAAIRDAAARARQLGAGPVVRPAAEPVAGPAAGPVAGPVAGARSPRPAAGEAAPKEERTAAPNVAADAAPDAATAPRMGGDPAAPRAGDEAAAPRAASARIFAGGGLVARARAAAPEARAPGGAGLSGASKPAMAAARRDAGMVEGAGAEAPRVDLPGGDAPRRGGAPEKRRAEPGFSGFGLGPSAERTARAEPALGAGPGAGAPEGRARAGRARAAAGRVIPAGVSALDAEAAQDAAAEGARPRRGAGAMALLSRFGGGRGAKPGRAASAGEEAGAELGTQGEAALRSGVAPAAMDAGMDAAMAAAAATEPGRLRLMLPELPDPETDAGIGAGSSAAQDVVQDAAPEAASDAASDVGAHGAQDAGEAARLAAEEEWKRSAHAPRISHRRLHAAQIEPPPSAEALRGWLALWRAQSEAQEAAMQEAAMLEAAALEAARSVEAGYAEARQDAFGPDDAGAEAADAQRDMDAAPDGAPRRFPAARPRRGSAAAAHAALRGAARAHAGHAARMAAAPRALLSRLRPSLNRAQRPASSPARSAAERARTRAATPRRRRDPSPSRMRYRLERYARRGWVRFAIHRVAPVLLLGALGAFCWSNEAVRSSGLELAAEARSWVEERPEFAITGLDVTGGDAALRAAVREEIAMQWPVSSLRVDFDALREDVMDVEGIAAAELRYGDDQRIKMQISARRPVALFRLDGQLMLVDRKGYPAGSIAAREDRADLPLIVGQGANDPAAVAEALALFAAAAPIRDRVRALVRVGERRWTLELDRGQQVLLPQEGALDALRVVLALDGAPEIGLLRRDVAVVDMRLPERPTLRLTDHALIGLTAMRAGEDA